jgi:hypothetical protein
MPRTSVTSRLVLALVVPALALPALADLTFPPISGVPVGPGLGVATFTNPLPPTWSNDDVAGSEQIVLVQVNKRFDAVGVIDSPILLNAHAMNSVPVGAATEYSINEIVTNNSGVAWSGFVMELGENVLSAFGPYSNINIHVTFDVPNQNPAPVCSAFPIVSLHAPHQLVFSGGILPHGGTMSIRFQIDNLTPSDLNFDGTIDMSDLYSITLREFPIAVPAPGSLALAGLGVVCVSRRRRAS